MAFIATAPIVRVKKTREKHKRETKKYVGKINSNGEVAVVVCSYYYYDFVIITTAMYIICWLYSTKKNSE